MINDTDSMYSCYECDKKWHFTSVVFISNAHNPSLIKGKTEDKPKLRDILKNTWQVVLKTVKFIGKKKKSEELSELRGAYGYIMTKHSGILDGTLEHKKDIK